MHQNSVVRVRERQWVRLKRTFPRETNNNRVLTTRGKKKQLLMLEEFTVDYGFPRGTNACLLGRSFGGVRDQITVTSVLSVFNISKLQIIQVYVLKACLKFSLSLVLV